MILVVDHYDSFTYNLVQLIESLGHDTQVVKSDAEPAEALAAREPAGVILSPGPGRPEAAGCFTDLLEVLAPEVPVLGVCLGHQAIGVEYGGTVDRTEPVHGKASKVFHEGRGILEGVHDPFEAGRYHSLVVERDDLPDSLGADRLDRGRSGDGDPASRTASVRRAVPPREHPDAGGPHDRAQLPGAHDVTSSEEPASR